MKNLRNVLALLIISLFSINSIAQSDISGKWIVGEKNTVVKIDTDKGIGKVISSDNTKAKIGKLMVKELHKTKGTWKGKIYIPKQKDWYDAEFTKKGNKLSIDISVGFFSKIWEWTKVNS